MSEIVQNSPEWFAIRCGRVTASRVADIVAKTKSGASASRANYAAQLVAERLTGNVEDGYRSPAMERGSETEADARLAYAFRAMVEITEVGFVPHPWIDMAGASPDGLVGDDGLVEIKCPNTATHIETLRGGSLPGRYDTQVQFQLACTGRAWCDFVSFDPRMPESMRLFIRRVKRNDARIAELEREVEVFLGEIDETVETLQRLYDMTAREAFRQSAAAA